MPSVTRKRITFKFLEKVSGGSGLWSTIMFLIYDFSIYDLRFFDLRFFVNHVFKAKLAAFGGGIKDFVQKNEKGSMSATPTHSQNFKTK